jgi:hypothetical protein
VRCMRAEMPLILFEIDPAKGNDGLLPARIAVWITGRSTHLPEPEYSPQTHARDINLESPFAY